MLVTWPAPGVLDSCCGVWPMMMISEFGAGSGDGPMVPICVPGKRSPSSAAGVERSSRVRAGEA